MSRDLEEGEPHLVLEAFAGSQLDPREFEYVPKPGPPSPLRRYVGGGVILTVAVEADGRRRNLLEVQARTWAADHGVPAPPILAAEPSGAWMAAEYVQKKPARGADYVRASLEVADVISTLPLPALGVSTSTWRAPRWDLPIRVARIAAGGLSPNAVRVAQRAAADLADLTTSHGDFYRRNVIASGPSRVMIVDWEFVGAAPKYTDHLRLWSTLTEPEDREIVLRHLLDGGADPVHVVALARWMAMRLLAENLSAPGRQRNRKDVARARVAVHESIQLERRILA